MNGPYFSSIMIIIITIMIMINHYCRIPALSWLSAGQLDGMNDSVLTQVSSYLLLRVCFNTLLLFLFLTSLVIDRVQHQHQNHHNRHQHHHHRISSNIINTSLQWMNTGKTSTLRAIDLDSSDNITEDMLGKFLDRW